MGAAEFGFRIREELQLVEPETGALVGRAPEPGPAGVPVCGTAEEARRWLVERRRWVAEWAAARGLAVMAAGLNLAGRGEAGRGRRGGGDASGLAGFGMRVEVGVPDREAAVRAMVGAASYVPHLLAVSASSPFHRGRDTGFASFRTILRERQPAAGLPFPVSSAGEYDRLVAVLSGGGRGNAVGWDLRPGERAPVLEWHFFDVTPWVDVAVFLAACARALTAMFIDRPPSQPTAVEMQLARENRWRAARYGLEARFYRMDPVSGEERGAADANRALVDRLASLAERLGDGPALACVERILERGNAASAMREVYGREGCVRAVARWVIGETASAGS